MFVVPADEYFAARRSGISTTNVGKRERGAAMVLSTTQPTALASNRGEDAPMRRRTVRPVRFDTFMLRILQPSGSEPAKAVPIPLKTPSVTMVP